ncbi:MAG: alkaline phosphatase [Ignavibacteriaceae bacterium]|nr:alkaline phosphatase [Ignavibacteriaceae bacterium]
MTRLALLFVLINFTISAQQTGIKTGNVIFIHPDGTSLSDWNTLRLLTVGPDNEINWDKLTGIGLYQGHLRDKASASSNAGATIHAYGVKADYFDFGLTDGKVPVARSGKQMSIMQEAIEKGVKTGLINSGSIIEPGTAVFVSSAEKRSYYEEITKEVLLSGVDLILSGGEEFMLPEGVAGRHVASGKRKDGLNLIEEMTQRGYKIIYTKDELKTLSPKEKKVLGVFAAVSTFNDKTEEVQKENNLFNYIETAPRVNEMTAYALEFFRDKGQFFLVVEEEGTDNFGNKNNAQGKLEALRGADLAIGEVLNFMKSNPGTMLVTAADSDAGGMQVTSGDLNIKDPALPLAANDSNGAPIDGKSGTSTPPFVSAPDKSGKIFYFGIVWATNNDVLGGVVARAHGLNAVRMKGKIDNTDIYRFMYLTLFGKWLD